MKHGNIKFTHLKPYAHFLYQNLLEEFASEDLKRNQELDLPILKFFQHLPPEQLKLLSKKGVGEYLNGIIEETAVDTIRKSMENWKTDKLQGVSKDKIGAADIALIYNARKHTLYKFLPRYTTDFAEALAIINEVEDFYTFQETLAIHTYSEIQQEKIKKNETRLKEAQALAHVGHWEYDLASGKLEWSDELYKIYGFELGSGIHSEKIQETILAEDFHSLHEKIRYATDHLSEFTHEYRIRRSDGEIRSIYESGYAKKNENGNIILRGISLDITERKKTEEELRLLNYKLEERVKERTKELSESEERYKTFIHQISEGIWRFELENGGISTEKPVDEQIESFYQKAFLAECNDMMAHTYGFSRAEDLLGMKLRDLLPLNEPANMEYLRSFIQSGYRLVDGETVELDKYGNQKYILNNLIGIIKNGELIRVWGSQRDITDRKLAEEALKRSEEQYRFLAETVPQIFWTAKPDGGLDYYNKKWYEYTGLTFEQTKEWGWKLVLHPDDLDNCLNFWNKSVRTGEPYQVEYRYKRASDGMYRWHLGRALPLKNSQGDIVKWFGTSTDIHEQKTALEELGRANIQLQKINNDLDNFVYTASHDLKAPISNIEGLINALVDSLGRECLNQEDAGEIIQMISKSVGRFRNTIQELSEIGKIQRNISEDIAEVDICDVVEDTKLMLSLEIENSESSIITNTFECPSIRFSRKDLKSIIYNLLSNAIKFRSPGHKPEIIIKTYRVPNYIVLSVKDNGLGIPANKIDKMFTMFRRFHDHVEGTGVGLYIVKRIVDNNQGKLEVESTLNKGTEFKIYFKTKD